MGLYMINSLRRDVSSCDHRFRMVAREVRLVSLRLLFFVLYNFSRFLKFIIGNDTEP